MVPTILIIGGTGAQDSAIVPALSKTGKYELHVLTRNANSPAAQEVQEVGHVTLIEGDSSNAADLRRAFQGLHACCVNTNGFALGEKDELWWGVKTFEIAAEAVVKHYVYSGLPYVFKRSGYNPRYNVGHLDGKGRVVGETTFSVWRAAYLLTDIFPCIRLHLSPAHASRELDDRQLLLLPRNFLCWPRPRASRRWQGICLHQFHQRWFHRNDHIARPRIVRPVGPRASRGGEANDPRPRNRARELVQRSQSFRRSHRQAGYLQAGIAASIFRGASESNAGWIGGGSQGLWTVDYDRLDGILPGRVRSVKEWMEKVGYMGEEKVGVLGTM